MSFFIYVCLEVDILHASFGAPCNRLYFTSWSSGDRDLGHRRESSEAGRPPRGRSAAVTIQSRPLDAYQCFQICTSLENVYSHLTISVLSLLTVTQAWCWLIQNPDKHCAGRQEELLSKRSRESSIRKFRKKSSGFAAYMQVLCVLL